jgi:IPT/TIG domain/S-layer homology domain
MTLSDAVVIDGFTQAGSSPNTLLVGNDAVYTVEIDGSGIPFTNYLFKVLTSGATLRGLLINRANGTSILIDSADNDNKVIGDWFGTDVTGTQYLGTNFNVFQIFGSNNHVGGTDPADHNVIAGGNSSGSATLDLEVGGSNVIQGNHIGVNAAGTAPLTTSPLPSYGISMAAAAHDNLIGGTTAGARNVVFANAPLLLGSGSHHNTIQGNYIGTDATGTVGFGASVGIFSNNAPHDGLIGGSAAGAGNVISGNGVGIVFTDGAGTNAVMGNFIGTDPTGLLPVPNTRGIDIQSPSAGSVIGGVNPGEGNTIAFNKGPGILAVFSTSYAGWTIRGNSIHSNAGLGIDLGGSGVDPNDIGDADDGPNRLQNFPIVSSVTATAGSTHIHGILHSSPSTIVDLDFYANPACSNFPREFLEGQTYIGSSQVTTDGSGRFEYDVTLPVTVEAGARITATATDSAGNTSEFSQRIIFSISPTSGSGAGGTAIAVSGTDFADPTTLTFGGAAAAVTFVDDRSLTTTSPALAPGTVNDVVALTAEGLTGTLVKGWVSDFLDVPEGQQFHSFVTTLVSNAITVGVGQGLYGVDQPTLRQQMAVFLMKALHGLCYVPPPCTTQIFTDVPCSSTFAPWINELVAEGITGGCGTGIYCPADPVKRQQMAVLLLKTFEGLGYTPSACVTATFDDVPCDSPFAPWIYDLVARGITGGCGGGLYCPGVAATRGQMAVFVVKTFSLQ